MNVEKIKGLLINMSELSLAIAEELGTLSAVTELPSVTIDAPVVTAPAAPVATSTTAETPVVTANADVELDDEGFPWDERINVETKTKVNSKLVKGGKAWRLKQKLDPAFVKQVREEIKPAIAEEVPLTTATLTAPAPVAGQVAPTAPSAPTAPTAPVASAPSAPTAPNHNAIKSEAAKVVNTIVNDFKVEYDDIVDLLKNEFNSEKGFETLLPEQSQDVLDRMKALLEEYNDVHQLVLQILQWGGDVHAANIQEQVKGIYMQFNAEQLGHVHYTDLAEVSRLMLEYHASWSAFAAGQQ